jgi:hypothetical protein
MKCVINAKGEITGFWEDGSKAPPEAVTCDKVYSIHGEGPPENQKFLYKLVDGKVEAG